MKKFLNAVMCFILFMVPIIMIIFSVAVILLVASSPFIYLEGSTKSTLYQHKYDKKIIWYKAAFIPDEMFVDTNSNVNVRLK